MGNENNTKFVDLGFCDVLTVVFIVLKLCGVITWSWLWVLAPLWISIVLVLLFIIVVIIYTKNFS